MDTEKDSTSITNSLKRDCDSEKNRNYKSLSQQVNISENSENVQTPSSNQSSSSVPLNGPKTRHINPMSDGELSEKRNNISTDTTDTYKSIASTSQGHIDKSTTTSEVIEITPSSSNRSNDNSVNTNQDLQLHQKHKVSLDVSENGFSVPSTSGMTMGGENVDSSVLRDNRKRPSSLKLKRPYSDNDSSSDTGNDGNDDYSLGSEDGCIYTYRGGEHLADLPSSFFSLDMGLPLDKHLPIPPNYNVPQQGHNREQGSRASSPDMDFLEMDFDPGPSCEANTSDESTPDVDAYVASKIFEESESIKKEAVPQSVPSIIGAARHSPSNVTASVPSTSEETFNAPSTSQSVLGQDETVENIHNYGPYITHVNSRGEEILVRRTMCHWPVNVPVSFHVTNGDVVTPRDVLDYEENLDSTLAHQINQNERPSFDGANLSTAFYHLTMAKKLVSDTAKLESEGRHTISTVDYITAEPSTSTTNIGIGCVEPPRCMVWAEHEACERQVTQIGTSACGATAVVNVFNALGVPVNLEKINSAIGTRQRANNAPIPRYLLCRAVAGCTAADLVTSINKASDGLVTARFFPTYPERAVALSHWLADWIALGAVPILTLNLQIGCEGEIPDAWHHQMVFGVSPRGVYLCNPIECVRENVLWPRLTSPSVLLVRTRDVLACAASDTDLTPLMFVPDRRFHTFNVLGQVANAIREWQASGWVEEGTRTRHIRIPAAYRAGVTVAALTGSQAHDTLMLAPQLPILSPPPTAYTK